MRKFIVSDIHGNGNVYYSIMGYLDNISKNEEIELYINGDLIDRGECSSEILLDVINRIHDNRFKIVYLGGNHELMMYKVLKKKINNKKVFPFNDWYLNGGKVTLYGLQKSKLNDIYNFISNLNIYHIFNEKIDNKNILLVHAACPYFMKYEKIKDNNIKVFYSVWARENNLIFKACNRKYFTIIGHTPNNSKYGFIYNKKGNYLNIDGGCGSYVSGLEEYNHAPLVEVKDNYLKILTFNNNNEIIYGNYFSIDDITPFNRDELEKEKRYLNNDIKIKKLN